MKHLLLFNIILIHFSTAVSAQGERKFNFWGVNPSVTVEPFYAKGELDVNLIPVVFQRSLNKRLDIRLNSICNLGVRKIENEISHFGLESALPIFLNQKKHAIDLSQGLFAAPVVSFTRNRLEGHSNIGLWLEPGYNLLFDNKFALSFGLQIGTTYFAYNGGQTKWGNHFGVKVIFGRWF